MFYKVAYQNAGLKCFRLKENSKIPATSHGFYDARLITDDDNYDGYNVGIATGDLVVIDIDNKNGKTGSLDWRLICQDLELQEEPATWIVQTPNNGLHIYFTSDVAIPSQTVGISKGIDVKSNGGYVVAPPSKLAEGEYRFNWPGPEDIPIAKIPKKLLEYLTIKPERTVEVDNTGSSIHSDSWAKILEDTTAYLHKLDPNESRQKWIRWLTGFKTILHPRAYEVFKAWSERSPKFNQKDFDRDWDSISPNGALTYKSIIHDAMLLNPQPIVEIKETKPTTSFDLESTLPEPQGLWLDMYKHYLVIFKHNQVYAHAGPAILLGYLFQRNYKYPVNGPAGLYHALIGEPASFKTTFCTMATRFLMKIGQSQLKLMVSSEGLIEGLSKSPSSMYIDDDGLDSFGSKMLDEYNPITTAVFDRVRVVYGSEDILMGTGNKKVENQVENIVHPRLTILQTGTVDSVRKLLSISKYNTSGMLSRFGFWRGTPVKTTLQDEINAKQNLHWDDFDLNERIKDVTGTVFDVKSSTVAPKFIEVKEPDYGSLEYKYLEEVRDKYVKMRDADPEFESVYDRLRKRVYTYAGIHAIGCKRLYLNEFDIFLADRLVDYHINVWKYYQSSIEPDTVTIIRDEYIKILKKQNTMRKCEIYKFLPRAYRVDKYIQVRKMVIDDMIKSNEVLFITGSKSFITLEDSLK